MTLMVATRNISLFSCIKCLIKSAGSHQLALHRVVHRLALLVRSRAYSLEDIDLHPFLPRSPPLSATVRLRPSVVVVLLYFVYFFCCCTLCLCKQKQNRKQEKTCSGCQIPPRPPRRQLPPLATFRPGRRPKADLKR